MTIEGKMWTMVPASSLVSGDVIRTYSGMRLVVQSKKDCGSAREGGHKFYLVEIAGEDFSRAYAPGDEVEALR